MAYPPGYGFALQYYIEETGRGYIYKEKKIVFLSARLRPLCVVQVAREKRVKGVCCLGDILTVYDKIIIISPKACPLRDNSI